MSTIGSSKSSVICRIAICLIGILFFWHSEVSAALLQIQSDTSTIAVGSTATLRLVVNTEGVAINSAEAVIRYSPEFVDVLSISKVGSVFSMWVEDPVFSNTAGTITINGGIPTPGYAGVYGPVVSVVVRAKKPGQTELAFTSASVLANDGMGTNVLNGQAGARLTIIDKAPVEPEPVYTAPSAAGLGLQIMSSTHPDQDKWYTDRNPGFRWTLPAGSDAVRTFMSRKSTDTPRILYSPAISEKAVTDADDGIWYFKAHTRVGGVWGSVGTYIVRIDATDPQMGDVTFAYNDQEQALDITSDIRDITSGLDHYEIYIDDNIVKTIPANEFVDGKYSLKFDASGDKAVRLVAIDRAGNSVESSGSFTAAGIEVPELDPLPSAVSEGEQLLIRGRVQDPDADVAVYIKDSEGKSVVLNTKSSGSDRSFFVLSPKLKSGGYDIWAKSGSGEAKSSSSIAHIEVTSQLLITIGSFTATAYSLVIVLLGVLVVVAVTFLGYYHLRSRHKMAMHSVVAQRDALKALFALKKSLDGDLALLQNTERNRQLTDEERRIKEAVIRDLTEVGRTLEQ